MQIYILRHGRAENAEPGQPDSERRLTADGKRKLRKILARTREAGISPEFILTSPYLRALETAQIAQEELGGVGKIVQTEVLTPASNCFDVWAELRNYREAQQIILVGHNPLLNELVCFFIGAPGAGVDLKKGALALVEMDTLGPQPRGTLISLLTAKMA